MKKLVLLVLVNMSCYGNTVVKESFIRKILICLCPCFKKTPKPEIRSSMRRVANSDNLKGMIPQIEENIERLKNRDLSGSLPNE